MSRIAYTLRGSGMPSLLLRFWKWILISTACSFVFTATMILTLHNDFAYGILRLWNDGFWWVLWVFEERFHYFRTPAFWNAFHYPFTYPAAMGVVLAVLFRIPHILRWYLLTCIAALCGWAWVVAREISVRGAIAGRIALAFTLTVAATAWPFCCGRAGYSKRADKLIAFAAFSGSHLWMAKSARSPKSQPASER